MDGWTDIQLVCLDGRLYLWTCLYTDVQMCSRRESTAVFLKRFRDEHGDEDACGSRIYKRFRRGRMWQPYSDFGSSEHLSSDFRRAPPGFIFGQDFELRFDSGSDVLVRRVFFMEHGLIA